MVIFLQEAGHPKAIDFKDKKFFLTLSYLADTFGYLNALNVSLQDENVNLIFCCERVQAFKEKLSFGKGVFSKVTWQIFPLVDERVQGITPAQDFITDVADHPRKLENNISRYLGEPKSYPSWIQQSFIAKVEDAEMLAEEIIELQVNCAAYPMFQAMTLLQFWTKQLVAYPNLAKAILHSIIPFPATYLCESAFSALVGIKLQSECDWIQVARCIFQYRKSSREQTN